MSAHVLRTESPPGATELVSVPSLEGAVLLPASMLASRIGTSSHALCAFLLQDLTQSYLL